MTRFSEEYQAYCKEFTDAPEIFHKYCAYFLISSVLSRKAYIVTGDRHLYANLWIVLVAPSSFYHKSTSLNIARKILDHVNENFAYPNEFSQEKMLQIFQKQPEGAFFFDEAASLFGMLSKDYNRSAEAMFTTLYGGGKYRRVTGIKEEQEIIVSDPFINILGASTIPWLVDTVSLSSMTGGFLPRFLFIPATERSKILPFQPKASTYRMNQLISLLGQIASKCAGEAVFSPQATSAHHDWYLRYVTHHEQETPKVQPFLSRLADDYILKLAIIISCDRGEFPNITLQAFTEAKHAVEFIARRFKDVIADEIGNTPFQRNVSKVLKIIKSANGVPVLQSFIYRKTRLQSQEIHKIIETLIASSEIEPVQLNSETRPATAYTYKNELDS